MLARVQSWLVLIGRLSRDVACANLRSWRAPGLGRNHLGRKRAREYNHAQGVSFRSGDSGARVQVHSSVRMLAVYACAKNGTPCNGEWTRQTNFDGCSRNCHLCTQLSSGVSTETSCQNKPTTRGEYSCVIVHLGLLDALSTSRVQ